MASYNVSKIQNSKNEVTGKKSEGCVKVVVSIFESNEHLNLKPQVKAGNTSEEEEITVYVEPPRLPLPVQDVS